MCHERDNLELPKDKFTTNINLICLSKFSLDTFSYKQPQCQVLHFNSFKS